MVYVASDGDGATLDSTCLVTIAVPYPAQCGSVFSTQTIGAGLVNDEFGTALYPIDDANGDSLTDVIVGSPGADTGGLDRGSVRYVYLGSSGGALAAGPTIDSSAFGGALNDGDLFGSAVCSLGDLNGDAVADLAVGATGDDGLGTNRGAVWILFMAADGSVFSHWKISDSTGFSGDLLDHGAFGASLTPLGDLNGDGTTDLAIGAPHDSPSGVQTGAVWVLLMNPNGTVLAAQKLAGLTGGFPDALDSQDQFGASLAFLGDLDGDGNPELAVGAPGDDVAGASNVGAVWILTLSRSGTVVQHRKLDRSSPLLSNELDSSDDFGRALASIGDFDCDGVSDLAVGAPKDDDGNTNNGAVWTLFLASDKSVKAVQKISATEGGGSSIGSGAEVGRAVACLGDLNGDSVPDLAISQPFYSSHRGIVRGHLGVCSTARGSLRGGSGVNPFTLVPVTSPGINAVFDLDVNCIGHSPASIVLFAYPSPSSGLTTTIGELLVDPFGSRIFLTVLQHVGSVERFSVNIPNDISVCGRAASIQSVCLGSPGAQLSNAVDVVIGR